jgi:hypothetical protein
MSSMQIGRPIPPGSIVEDRRPMPLESNVREGLATILDTLIPGTDSLPSGRAVEAHQELIDRVLEADPRLEPVVRQAGEHARAAGACTLTEIAEWSGGNLESLVFALNAAYYMSKRVRSALGYPGQARRPISLATREEVCSDELIAPVLARGAAYVPTPG